MTLRLVILASGQGSNAKAILEAIANKQLDAEVVCIISNNPDAAVLTIAASHSIKTMSIPHKEITRQVHEQQLINAIKPLNADYIILAGYMRLFTAEFINAFPPNHIINIHPSLLPQFKGCNAYGDAWEAGVSESGISIHYVTEAMDEGPMICQRSFPRYPEDTFEHFQTRGLSLEHQLYSQVLQELALQKNCKGEKTCLPV